VPSGEDLEKFRGYFEHIVWQARSDASFFDQIGNYVAGICDVASKHKVMLNPGFVSIALSIRVMEGVALALHENALIWKIAQAIILREKASDAMEEAGVGEVIEDVKRKVNDLYRDVVGGPDGIFKEEGGTKMKKKFVE
jgi:predicted unusual protein kinase regulating ubiquinone biosynthesis (AarF/ABC1/UbiB family)